MCDLLNVGCLSRISLKFRVRKNKQAGNQKETPQYKSRFSFEISKKTAFILRGPKINVERPNV